MVGRRGVVSLKSGSTERARKRRVDREATNYHVAALGAAHL